MEEQKPLFVYDCDNTLQSTMAVVWGKLKLQQLTTLSKEEFVQQNSDELNSSKAMLPGMADMVRYTATKGNNILISDGNPGQEDGCKELRHDLKNYFQNWSYKGEEVEWGRTPNLMPKEHLEVSKELYKTFVPSQIFVIGDSVEDYDLALSLAYCIKKYARLVKTPHIKPAVVFFKIGPSGETVLNAKVPVVTAPSGAALQQAIAAYLEPDQKQTQRKKVIPSQHGL